MRLTASLLTDAYDSTKGPYPPNPRQVGAGVGLDGVYAGPDAQNNNPVDIGGALWASGRGGVSTQSPTVVRQEAHVGGPLSASNDPLTIADDAYVAGSVTGTSSISIGKALHVTAGAAISGNVTRGQTVTEVVTVPDPCDCSPQKLVPIDAIVAAQRPPNNDDALIHLDPDVLATPSPSSASARLDLPCGRYYLSKINMPGSSVTIFAHGRTAVFIDGDVVGQVVSFVLDPTGELDVFVKGNITAGGELVVGSPNYPALSRTYVGGNATLLLSGEAGRIAGNLYAAYAPVSVVSHLILYGALSANDFNNSEAAEIHYDRAVLNAGNACRGPAPDGGNRQCKSCGDCGNQACIDGSCGPCTSNEQCCAPLTCQGGACQPCQDRSCYVVPR